MIFGITTLDFAEMQKKVQNSKKTNKNKTNLGPKMPYLGILGCKFERVLSYFQHLRICQTAKFRAKLKAFNFGTKNDVFRCFYAAFLKKNYCHIRFF